MRYAFMSFSVPELSLEAALARAAEWGYEGFEPRVAGKPGHPTHAHGVELERTPAERAAVARAFVSAGVSCCCLALGCRFADPETSESQTDEALRYLELASDIGAPLVRVFGGRIPAGITRASATDHVAAALRRLAPRAEVLGVGVALETHDDWCDPAAVAAVMSQVDHPAVGVVWDVMHPVRFGLATMAEAHAALAPWIRHVHIHDGLNGADLRFRPFGEGEYDLVAAFSALRGWGYSGYLSGEWIQCEATISLAEELRRMRALEDRLAAGPAA